MIWRQKFSYLLFSIALLLTGLTLTALLPRLSHAVVEEEFADRFINRIQPFFSSRPIEFLFGEKKVRIAYRRFANSQNRGLVLVVPGYSESQEKYAELIYDLFQEGYSVVIFDHRGQGHSDRLLKDQKLAHVDDFNNFVKDMQTLKVQVLDSFAPTPRFVIAHSMGAAVTARYLASYPETFKAAVLSSPMISIDLHRWIQNTLLFVLSPLSYVGLDHFYVRGPKDPQTFQFDTNRVTHSEVRYKYLQLKTAEKFPDAQVWGVSAGWLYQSLLATTTLVKEARKIKTPLLIFQAGVDSYVESAPQVLFCQNAQDCVITPFALAKHEIYMESDRVRGPALAQTLQFFKAHSP